MLSTDIHHGLFGDFSTLIGQIRWLMQDAQTILMMLATKMILASLFQLTIFDEVYYEKK